jgi:hypothetical protein
MRYLPEGEKRTKDMFLKKGGWISAKSVELSKSLILIDITFSLFMVDLNWIGLSDSSSWIWSEFTLDLLPPIKLLPEPATPYKPSKLKI